MTSKTTLAPLLAVYTIQRSGSGWGIGLNGHDMDLQLSLEDAVTAAVTAAKDAYAKGFGATVTIQAGGTTAPLWSNGNLTRPERANGRPVDVISQAVPPGPGDAHQRSRNYPKLNPALILSTIQALARAGLGRFYQSKAQQPVYGQDERHAAALAV